MHFIFPSTCILCNALSNRKIDLCSACENDLPFLKNEEQIIYGVLVKVSTLFYYQAPIKQLILGLKFNNRLINAKILGELLALYLYKQYQNQDKPEVIIPVPLHQERLHTRGYNQALELARPIAKKLNIKINKSGIERVKNTLAQALLPAKKRTKNIEHAFSVNLSKFEHYKHVAVIDDVITTGNTATELCKALHQKGISKIDVWCCAKVRLLPSIARISAAAATMTSTATTR